ncbi:hypothetical protein [Methylorubrum extorquens]|uniref:hypothetical protein n=1 Tax=Methylorubrum extorquens TaxID=408 RepID=UPI0002EBE705|nr:hypothetical protein [Methylorubrum extorquens]MCP1546213.1 hypothetical protein [Methylorubrum extorquens]MCP1590880.1 hypothetical protein [Methylorubrum extorquens]
MAKRKPTPVRRTFHSVEVVEFEGGRIVKEVCEEPGRSSILVVGHFRSRGAEPVEPAPAIGDFIARLLGRAKPSDGE